MAGRITQADIDHYARRWKERVAELEAENAQLRSALPIEPTAEMYSAAHAVEITSIPEIGSVRLNTNEIRAIYQAMVGAAKPTPNAEVIGVRSTSG